MKSLTCNYGRSLTGDWWRKPSIWCLPIYIVQTTKDCSNSLLGSYRKRPDRGFQDFPKCLRSSLEEESCMSILLPCLRGLGLGDSLLPQVLPPDRDRLDSRIFISSPPIWNSFLIFSTSNGFNGEIVLMSSLHFSLSFGDISSSCASVFNKNVNRNMKMIFGRRKRVVDASMAGR